MESRPEAALTAGRRRHGRHLFRTVRLNAAGRAALVGASLASAALGAAVAHVLGRATWVGALFGFPLVVAVLVVVDRRRYRGTTVSFGWTDDVSEVEAVAYGLRRGGVDAVVDLDGPTLRFRRQDWRAVAAKLPLPPELLRRRP